MAAKLKVYLKADDKGTRGGNNYSYFRGKVEFIAIQPLILLSKVGKWREARKWILKNHPSEMKGKMVVIVMRKNDAEEKRHKTNGKTNFCSLFINIEGENY